MAGEAAKQQVVAGGDPRLDQLPGLAIAAAQRRRDIAALV
jgi:hypothetical protein